MERTLIILKPDAVQRGLVGEILSRFEKAGLKIVATKMLQPDYDHYYHHYETISKMVTRRGKEAFEANLTSMQEGPVIACVLEGIEAVAVVRKMVGATMPNEAQPGTIRGDYAHMSLDHATKQGTGVPNVIHASGDKTEAEAEITHWFSESEIYDYQTVHERYTQSRQK
jgi:nucleoside-diphosphate kinase